MNLVDGNISDLFFNTDLGATARHDDKGQFVDYDHEALRAEAQMFLGCLYRLGVAVPTDDELITDFFNRQ